MDKKKPKYSEAVEHVRETLNKTRIPKPLARMIDKLQKYIDLPWLLPSLDQVDGRHSHAQKRLRLTDMQVLIAIATYLDWASLRIGVTKKIEMDPVKHRAMMARYKKLYGDISESTWYRSISRLVRAGFLLSTPMNVKNSNDQVRGKAAYKTLTLKFFKELGLAKGGWLDKERELSQKRLNRYGLSNRWAEYESELAHAKRQHHISAERLLVGELDSEPPPTDSPPIESYALI